MAASSERFGKISRRMWRDEAFLALSAPKPNARDLWIYLLTGPHNTAIPGLFSIGELGLAEALGWPVAATRRCLAELERAGSAGKNSLPMAIVDRKSVLIWLPNAIRHNAPPNPSVVGGWDGSWKLLPECDLRERAGRHIGLFLESLGAGYVSAFHAVIGASEAPGKPPEPTPSEPPHVDPEGTPEGGSEGRHGVATEGTPEVAHPDQEIEQESEKDPDPGHTHTAREAVSDGPPPDPVAAELLDELRAHRALAPVATLRLAEELAGRILTTGRRVADVRTAIGEAARDIGAEESTSGPLLPRDIAKTVARYADKARRQTQAGAPKGPSGPHRDDIVVAPRGAQ